MVLALRQLQVARALLPGHLTAQPTVALLRALCILLPSSEICHTLERRYASKRYRLGYPYTVMLSEAKHPRSSVKKETAETLRCAQGDRPRSVSLFFSYTPLVSCPSDSQFKSRRFGHASAAPSGAP
ncbi:hypothetical protein SBA2_10097 [Acidobacteriia bacterium SbA2]|nr:hypothetical protein SBA2_10097 [Acidobacteriia bacterium SbA2]